MDKLNQNVKSEWHPALHFFTRLDELEKSGNYYCVEVASGNYTLHNLRRFYGVLVAMGYMVRTLLVEGLAKRLDEDIDAISSKLQKQNLERCPKLVKELARMELIMYRDLQRYAQEVGLGLPIKVRMNLNKRLREDLV